MQTDSPEGLTDVDPEFMNELMEEQQIVPVPEPNKFHFGIRLTRPPEEVEPIMDKVLKMSGPWANYQWPYCYVNHQPDEGTPNLHAHIYLTGHNFDLKEMKKVKVTLQKHFNRAGVTQNSNYAISIYKGGFANFAFYAKHSHDPLIGGFDDQQQMYADSDVYVKHRQDANVDCDEAEEDLNKALKHPNKALTDFNIVRLMRRYCRHKRIGVRNFRECLIGLINDTDWRPGKGLTRPINPCIINEFENGSNTSGATWVDYLYRSPIW